MHVLEKLGHQSDPDLTPQFYMYKKTIWLQNVAKVQTETTLSVCGSLNGKFLQVKHWIF